MKYAYKAVNINGKEAEGVVEARDKKTALLTLRDRSLFPTELKEVKPMSALNIDIGSSKIPKKALGVFCSQFATILKAGVPTAQALGIIAEQTEHKRLKAILFTVNEDIQKGFTLSQAIGQHQKSFPDILVSMIEAGEASGTLDTSLERLALQFDKENKLREKVKAAVTYPIIVGSLAVLIVVALMIFVVPLFVSIFAQMQAELPPLTKAILAISDFIRNQWPLIICFIALLVLLWKTYKRSATGRMQLDKIKLRLPIFGKISLKLLAAQFSRTLCTLISSGVPLTDSMLITGRAVSNRFAERKVEYVAEQVKEGKTLSSSFAQMQLLPNMLVQMTKIGEESGTLDYMLERTADYYEMEAESAIQRLTTLLEPLMILFVGGLVLLIALSILTPVFQMSQNVSNYMNKQ
jgi:type IV pilus assembly protein PilC